MKIREWSRLRTSNGYRGYCRMEKFEKRLLLGRLLTRSGDQAWSFGVPLALIAIFSNEARPALIYFLGITLGNVIVTPHIGKFIDSLPRLRLIKIGIVVQMVSITLALGSAFAIQAFVKDFGSNYDFRVFLAMAFLIVFGLGAQAGSTIMEISVGSDIVPTIIPAERIGAFNSRFRQVDLFTEVASPVIAGIILSLAGDKFPLLGFSLIWLWNVLSFIPELLLLRSVYVEKEQILSRKMIERSTRHLSVWEKLAVGWSDLKRQKISVAIFSYSLLWLSALSPHGVLLTAFLKSGWHIPDMLLGTFRALGAVFGILATIFFPVLLKRRGLLDTSKIFIISQAICVGLALLAFYFASSTMQFTFLFLILCSRIGLYGYSLAENQIRQLTIHESERGKVNGAGSALNSLATLVLFGLGAVLSDPKDFVYLVLISTISVITAATMVVLWKPEIKELDTRT